MDCTFIILFYLNGQLAPHSSVLLKDTDMWTGRSQWSNRQVDNLLYPLSHTAALNDDASALAPPISTGKPCPSVVHFQQVRAKGAHYPALDSIWLGLESGLSWRGVNGAELTPKWTHHRRDGNRWGSLVHMASFSSLNRPAPVFLLHSTSASHTPAPPLLFPLQPSQRVMHRNSWI